MVKAGAVTDDIAAIGITTHRESAMAWDRATGEPIHPAVMWMSKQTDPIVERWQAAGLGEEIRRRTGVFNDSYFSAGKLAWLMEEVPDARRHCGQTLQWMRERLHVLGPDDSVDAVVASVPDTGGVYVVPAFAGMCAPHWAREAHAGIVGITLETEAAHVVRAGVEAMAYQTRDNVDVLVASGTPVPALKVDGGAARSDLLCQFQADILGIPVLRPTELERTALGVAHLAGMGVGLWKQQDLADGWELDREFEPSISETRRAELYAGWEDAVRQVLKR